VFLEGGKRTLSKPIIKKDPITPDILNTSIDMYGKDHSNLKNVRLCAMLLLGKMYLKSQETGHALPLVLAITTLFPRLYTSVFPDTMFTTI
jgi:hypothetical protein